MGCWIEIQRLTRIARLNRAGWFEREGREPHDFHPTADVARARWKARAEASWLSQVKWLEPEVGSNPRNSADQFEFEFKS